MFSSRRTTWLATGLVGAALTACASGSGSQGMNRGPSRSATVIRVAAPPDTVMQRAWEVLRNDGIQPRWFSRSADDSTNIARMESDWIYVPRVLDSATFGSMSEPEKYVKMLFWAEPERGGTLLFVDALYNPLSNPSEPAQWPLMRPVPGAHPAWQYVQLFGQNLARRLEAGKSSED
ncbi:MAG: hypothetical protein Q8W45_04960 [Candidatus Palauibacterales bacterium]|jgi:hypothetical protein|nr:hypothetical protein [Candidatus Palauibacterales bacterium]